MRVPIAYYMMLLYATVMFKPLIPIVSDFLSHTFSEAVHIATVHAIYGGNHLQKEISNTASDNNKHQSTTNTEDQVPVHVSTNECIYNYRLNSPGKNYPVFNPYKLSSAFISKLAPPPKFFR